MADEDVGWVELKKEGTRRMMQTHSTRSENVIELERCNFGIGSFPAL